MTNSRRMRAVATFAGLVLVLLAGSWSESSAKSKKRKPPTEPPVAVALPQSVIQEAAAYSAYISRTSAISPAFADGPSVARSLATGAAYEPNQMVRGAISYGAVVALQEPDFVASFRGYRDSTQRREVAYSILRDPYYVTAFKGSADAAGAIIEAVGGQGRALFDQGQLVKQSAYDVQKSNWAGREVADRTGRLQATKAVSAAPLIPDAAEAARLLRAIHDAGQGGQSVLTSKGAEPPYNTLVIRSLAVAALAALGQGADGDASAFTSLMVDPVNSTCLKMSKLNLYQCLAVAKPHYEDVFCLGEHVMKDTGRCLMKSAGAVMPDEPRKTYVANNAQPYKPTTKRAPAKKKK